jgi:hypothetical protein
MAETDEPEKEGMLSRGESAARDDPPMQKRHQGVRHRDPELPHLLERNGTSTLGWICFESPWISMWTGTAQGGDLPVFESILYAVEICQRCTDELALRHIPGFSLYEHEKRDSMNRWEVSSWVTLLTQCAETRHANHCPCFLNISYALPTCHPRRHGQRSLVGSPETTVQKRACPLTDPSGAIAILPSTNSLCRQLMLRPLNLLVSRWSKTMAPGL